MLTYGPDTYHLIPECLNQDVRITDHLNGFDKNFRNEILDTIQHNCVNVYTTYFVDDRVQKNYPNLKFNFDFDEFRPFFLEQYNTKFNTDKNFKNFLCSFNGVEHVSRQFLVGALKKFGWFNPDYNTKNFITFKERVDGNVDKFFEDPREADFYRKFILYDNHDRFYETTYSINWQRQHGQHNAQVLLEKFNQSFVHLVSETIATSWQPQATEKMFNAIAVKTLWVAYAQPRFYYWVEKFFGIKRFNRIFDYEFDLIENPVIRLVAILTMLSKFEKLSVADWHDLYLLEQDTIEYNYDWYLSGDCSKHIQQFNGYPTTCT